MVIIVNIVNVFSTGVGISWDRLKMRLVRIVKFCCLCVFKLMWVFFVMYFIKGVRRGILGLNAARCVGGVETQLIVTMSTGLV